MPLGFIRRSASITLAQSSAARIRDEIIKELLDDVCPDPNGRHHQFVEEFKESIDMDQVDLFNEAVNQAKHCYDKWSDPNLIVNSFEDFLYILDRIVVKAPGRYSPDRKGPAIGQPVGTPIHLVLDLIINTPAAHALFMQPKFNKALGTLLSRWGEWLKSPESSELLATEWFTPEGLQMLESGLGGTSFDETFEHTAAPPGRYDSWDSFFTRRFKSPIEKLRPIPSPPPNSTISYLYSACESTIFRTAKDVQRYDTFWLKNQDYSLYDILGGKNGTFAEKYAPLLQGCSAYQAFLHAVDYHRWHCPIEGEVIHSIFEGTYYAVLPNDGTPPFNHPRFPQGDPHGAIVRSQPWLNAVATRAVFIITPTDPNSPIELAALIAVGMAEVSTCDVTYDKGNEGKPVYVKVGDELGTFRFGGSSCTLFVKTKPNYKLVFRDDVNKPIRPGQHRWVNSVVGQFRKKVPSVVDRARNRWKINYLDL